MNVTGWPTKVNQKILSDTGITVGEGGYVEDQTSTGWQERRLTSLAIPDSFQVTMDFDWGGDDPLYPRDNNGYTEYDRFIRWYKFVHKRGANPFWFPCITKHPVTNLLSTDGSKMCLYKITSPLNEKESGFSNRITMTWKEVYSGIIEIPEETAKLDSITAFQDHIDLKFTATPSTIPAISDFYFSIKSNDPSYTESLPPMTFKEITGNDSNYTLWFVTPLTPGSFEVSVTYPKTNGITKKGTVSVAGESAPEEILSSNGISITDFRVGRYYFFVETSEYLQEIPSTKEFKLTNYTYKKLDGTPDTPSQITFANITRTHTGANDNEFLIHLKTPLPLGIYNFTLQWRDATPYTASEFKVEE